MFWEDVGIQHHHDAGDGRKHHRVEATQFASFPVPGPPSQPSIFATKLSHLHGSVHTRSVTS